MKVISIKEPYASLIKNKIKLIETRSWKTNYRGELYIHSSLSKLSKEIKNNKELMSLIDEETLKYGYILCRCKLVDCVYMTQEYIDNMKNNNYIEYLCGEYKIGRYAWVLQDIEVIDEIKAKGQLGIWNYNK